MTPLTGAEKQILMLLEFLNTKGEPCPDLTFLEKAGKQYYCSFKMPWEGGFSALLSRGVIFTSPDGLRADDRYREAAGSLRSTHPRFKYWYNDWYRTAESSTVHTTLCERVYGIDLCQTGMVTKSQVKTLAEQAGEIGPSVILDIGCGSGRILRYICVHTGSRGVGIDPIVSGIRLAREKLGNREPELRFICGDVRSYLTKEDSFDVIVSCDSLYFLGEEIEGIIQDWCHSIRKGGCLLILYSAWYGKDTSLAWDGTKLGLVLTSRQMQFRVIDFTEEDKTHWIEKRKALDDLEHAFAEEGNDLLWEKRSTEARIFSGLAQRGEMRRYLYIIEV